MIERHYSDLEPVKAIDQLRGEETRRLIDAGTVLYEAYQSNKVAKTKKRDNQTTIKMSSQTTNPLIDILCYPPDLNSETASDN